MFTSLIIFSTTDGHTKKICERISKFLDNEKPTKIVSLNEATKLNLSQFQRIIIGASIRYGKHNPQLFNFINKNQDILNRLNTAFFSVNVVARKTAKNTPLTNPYVIKFLKKISWKPTKVAVFAGRVDYPSYKLVDKYMIRFIMWLTNGPTDVSKSYEFTNWNEVSKFGKAIKEM